MRNARFLLANSLTLALFSGASFASTGFPSEAIKFVVPYAPDVPTMAEAGVEGYAVEPWFALYGPAGISPEVVEILNKAFSAALESKEVKEELENAGFTPKSSSSQELEDFSASEYERWRSVVGNANLQM